MSLRMAMVGMTGLGLRIQGRGASGRLWPWTPLHCAGPESSRGARRVCCGDAALCRFADACTCGQVTRRRTRRREKNSEGGAFVWLALDADDAVVFLNNPLANGQAEAGAVLLGGARRLKQPGHVFGRDAHAGVLYADADAMRTAGFGRSVGGDRFGDDRQRSVWPH